jgi:hypothetical protein
MGVRAGADRDDKTRRGLSPLEMSRVSERTHSTSSSRRPKAELAVPGYIDEEASSIGR